MRNSERILYGYDKQLDYLIHRLERQSLEDFLNHLKVQNIEYVFTMSDYGIRLVNGEC